MEAMFPEREDDPRAIEGTLAHAVMAAVVMGTPMPEHATDEMLDGADMMADDVRAQRALSPQVHTLHSEQHIKCPSIHSECHGTPDLSLLNLSLMRLTVWDYKFGHVYVSAYENWQLITYVAGLCENYGTATTDNLMVDMRVVQPRNYHPDGPVRSWLVPFKDLTPYFAKLRAQGALALLPDPACRVGSHCENCKARHACPTLQGGSYMGVELAGQAIPFDLEPRAKGRELARLTTAADMLKARISGLEADVLYLAKTGTNVPGWMAKQGTGREKWARPVEEIVALGDMMGVSVAKPGAMTPKQAIAAGLDAAVVRQYTETPPGEIKLVRDDGSKSRATFGAQTK